MPQSEIIFYTVKDPVAKMRALIHIADLHLKNREKLQMVLPNDAALKFVEDLLWSYPKESFRPHSIGYPQPMQDLILLTQNPEVLPSYSAVFNLCQDALPASVHVKKLYELEDLTSTERAKWFEKKFPLYQKAGYVITAGTIF